MVYAFVASAFRLMDALIHQSATCSPSYEARAASGGSWVKQLDCWFRGIVTRSAVGPRTVYLVAVFAFVSRYGLSPLTTTLSLDVLHVRRVPRSPKSFDWQPPSQSKVRYMAWCSSHVQCRCRGFQLHGKLQVCLEVSCLLTAGNDQGV